MVQLAFLEECRLCGAEIHEEELRMRFRDMIEQTVSYIVVRPAHVSDDKDTVDVKVPQGISAGARGSYSFRNAVAC